MLLFGTISLILLWAVSTVFGKKAAAWLVLGTAAAVILFVAVILAIEAKRSQQPRRDPFDQIQAPVQVGPSPTQALPASGRDQFGGIPVDQGRLAITKSEPLPSDKRTGERR
jgi:hypothetical protein